MKNLFKFGFLALAITLTTSSCNLFGSKSAAKIDTLKKDSLKIDSAKKDSAKADSFKKDSVEKK